MINKEHDKQLTPEGFCELAAAHIMQHLPQTEKKYMIRIPKAYIDGLPKCPKKDLPFPMPQIMADWGRWSGLCVYDDPEYPECVQVEVSEEAYLAMEAELKKADEENACSK